jgi:hypothetical protein
MNSEPKLSEAISFTVTVNKCWVTSLTAAAAIPNYDYVLGSTKILIPIPSLTQTPACNDSILYTLNTIPSFVQIEGINVALSGSDLTQAGKIRTILTARASVSGATK